VNLGPGVRFRVRMGVEAGALTGLETQVGRVIVGVGAWTGACVGKAY
jgi:hypothetical protein